MPPADSGGAGGARVPLCVVPTTLGPGSAGRSQGCGVQTCVGLPFAPEAPHRSWRHPLSVSACGGLFVGRELHGCSWLWTTGGPGQLSDLSSFGPVTCR